MHCTNENKVFKILVGSHNYNLATAESDKDWKSFHLPTLKQLIENTNFNKSIITPTEDVEYKSIMSLTSLLYKGNPAYLELLFSREYEVDDNYENLLKTMISHNEDIARMNLPRLFASTMGTINEKYSKLYKLNSSNQHKLDQFGYDTKQLMHLVRSSELLSRYASSGFTDYASSLVYNEADRETMLNIKNGVIEKSKVDDFAKHYIAKAESVKDQYCNYGVYGVTNKWLNELILHYIYNNIKMK